MQKLDRSGIATRYICLSCPHLFYPFGSQIFYLRVPPYNIWNSIHSIVGSLGVPGLNGAAFNQPGMNPSFPTSVLPTTAIPSFVNEHVGLPSECLLLKNMFDPATEVNACFCFLFFLFCLSWEKQVSAIIAINIKPLFCCRRNQTLILKSETTLRMNVQSMAQSTIYT